MIELSGIEFGYPGGDFRLVLPEMRIGHGERVAVVGPSGCGKSTLLHLIAGILLPSRGTVRVGPLTVSTLGDAARRSFRIRNIGFVFQEFELIEYLSVFDNVLHPYRIGAGLRLDDEIRLRARMLAEAVGIADRIEHLPARLSHGERQRAAIARALVARPSLILADEATGNLDPFNKTRILDLIFEACDRNDATLVAVTHDRELVPRFGRVIDLGSR